MTAPLHEWAPASLRTALRAAWGMDAITRVLLWDPRDEIVHVTPGLLVLLDAHATADGEPLSNLLRLALLALARVVDGVVLEEVKLHESRHGKGTALSLLDDSVDLQRGLVRSIAQLWLAHIRHILRPHAFALLRMLVHVCFGRPAATVTSELGAVQPGSMPADLAALLAVHISGVCAMEALLRTLLRCSWFAVAKLGVPALYDIRTATSPLRSTALEPSTPFDLSAWLKAVSVITVPSCEADKYLAVQPAGAVEPSSSSSSSSGSFTVLTPVLVKAVSKHLPALTPPADRDLIINRRLRLRAGDSMSRPELAALVHVADLLLQRYLSATPAPVHDAVELKYVHNHASLAALEVRLYVNPSVLAASAAAVPVPTASLAQLQPPARNEVHPTAPPAEQSHVRANDASRASSASKHGQQSSRGPRDTSANRGERTGSVAAVPNIDVATTSGSTSAATSRSTAYSTSGSPSLGAAVAHSGDWDVPARKRRHSVLTSDVALMAPALVESADDAMSRAVHEIQQELLRRDAATHPRASSSSSVLDEPYDESRAVPLIRSRPDLQVAASTAASVKALVAAAPVGVAVKKQSSRRASDHADVREHTQKRAHAPSSARKRRRDSEDAAAGTAGE